MNIVRADVKRAPKITERQMLRIALATFDQVSIGMHKRPTSSCPVWKMEVLKEKEVEDNNEEKKIIINNNKKTNRTTCSILLFIFVASSSPSFHHSQGKSHA